MVRFILRRLIWLPFTIILVTFLIYLAVRIGWNPLATYLKANPRASAKKKQQYIDANGLYPGFTGYLRGYKEWLFNFLRGPDHWPRSIKGGEVWPTLRYSIFNTLRLAGAAAITGILIGLGLGILAAKNPGGWLDTSINSTAFFVGAIPPFVSGVVLQLTFAVSLGWLPPVGVYPPGHEGFDLLLMIKHMILPIAAVAIQTIAAYSRYMRASILDVASADYLRTARAKGISERRVLFRHSVRNALIPVVTVIALDIGGLIGGLIITENIFNYPGMGVYFVSAVNDGDIPKMLPFMVLVIISVLVFNLIADVMYAQLDPRIRLD